MEILSMADNKRIMVILTLLLLMIVLNPVLVNGAEKDSLPSVISTRKIYTGKPYASFTSLIYYEGRFYCAFREAKKHYDPIGKDVGVVKILSSRNGKHWRQFLIYKVDGFDLRDPKLTVTPEGKAMLLVEKVKYEKRVATFRKSCVSFFSSNKSHTELVPVNFEPKMDWNWLWDVTWIEGAAYGYIYAPYFALVKSTDGINYKPINRPAIDNSPTEASVVKLKNKFVTVVRRNHNAYVGMSSDGNQWQWKDGGTQMGCPKLFIYNDEVYAVGRAYNGKTNCTALFSVDIESGKLTKLLELSSDRDSAYPGAVVKDGILYLSYYQGNLMESSIYFTKIKL